eukprot:gnl/MRDRNA2_/MRDRNA2_74183_c0_seq1.p1 gnl/MRDRNA2_/MRDRNA2_74183_c0~~gnl/MRDRNA2_/MRDRNA2_74183_c0_seq1.p1  ORF type:complete len:1030 (-),score=157.71 gnl/MRDRNA2_/MRDRNA2_74183_c0_seq1:57-3146(-)
MPIRPPTAQATASSTKDKLPTVVPIRPQTPKEGVVKPQSPPKVKFQSDENDSHHSKKEPNGVGNGPTGRSATGIRPAPRNIGGLKSAAYKVIVNRRVQENLDFQGTVSAYVKAEIAHHQWTNHTQAMKALQGVRDFADKAIEVEKEVAHAGWKWSMRYIGKLAETLMLRKVYDPRAHHGGDQDDHGTWTPTLDRTRLEHRVLLELKLVVMLPKAMLFLVLTSAFVLMQNVEHRSSLFADAHVAIRDQLNLEEKLHEVKTAPDTVNFLDEFVTSVQVLNPLNTFYWCPSDKAEKIEPPKYTISIEGKLACDVDKAEYEDHYLGTSQAKKQRNQIISKVEKIEDRMGKLEVLLSNQGGQQNTTSSDTESIDQCAVQDPWRPCDPGETVVDPGPAPKSYRRHNPFVNIIGGVVPPLVYQKRLKPKNCQSAFTDFYNNQPSSANDEAPHNAPKDDPLIRCRSNEFFSGTYRGSEPMILDGDPVYHTFLDKEVMNGIKQLGWIDDLTSFLRVVQFLYTPGEEYLSVVLVDFHLHSTGRVRAKYQMTSFIDLRESPVLGEWLLYSIIAFITTLVELIRQVRRFCNGRHHRGIYFPTVHPYKPSKLHTFDCMLYIILAIFIPARIMAVFLAEGRSAKVLMEPLVLAVSEARWQKSTTAGGSAVDSFFESLAVTMRVIDEYDFLKGVSYMIILCLIIRVILHFGMHPRIAIISDTCTMAFDNVLHYMFVFLWVFIAFAWLAHWTFGVDKPLFQTLQSSLHTACRMLIGDWNFEEQWKEHRLQLLWYFCYTFVIYFLLMNIFLAIMVEAFLSLKKESEVTIIERSFPADICTVVLHRVLQVAHDWPNHASMLDYLHRHSHISQPVTRRELVKGLGIDEAAADCMLRYYYFILGDRILPQQNLMMMQKEQEHELELQELKSVFESEVFDQAYIKAVTKIQAVIRGAIARKREHDRLLQAHQRAGEKRVRDIEKTLGFLVERMESVEASQSRLEQSVVNLTTLLQQKFLADEAVEKFPEQRPSDQGCKAACVGQSGWAPL